ncbi:hypothetical protein RB195_015182 [Necator americanus]|uniref:Chondroitin proteoglycan 3 n=1 Tax=Necator americanus TaxID=51031 RepID=A0ABR1E549_NECAM
MQRPPFIILTLTATFSLPLFETDPVLVFSDELTADEVAALESSGLERSANEDNMKEIIAEAVSNKICKPFGVCFGNDDCNGGKCVGAFVGKCNCNACLDFWLCETDAACGGLIGACNKTTKTCDCQAGFKAAGYPFFVDALRGLCNRKSCNKKNAVAKCFGLPCHFGRCSC